MQKGFATLYFVLLALFLVVSIAGSSFLLLSWQQRVGRNVQDSVQAYWAGEAGIEDSLLRLKSGMSFVNPISLAVGEGVATTVITETAPGTNRVVAQGDDASRIRNVEVLFGLSGTAPAFFYGAHMGDGGLQMDNLSRVEGNVFSNGNIVVTSGKAEITETATVAGVGGSMSRVTSRHAFADICTRADIKQELHANTPGNCTYGSFIPLGTPPDPVPLPITEEEIWQWKDDAVAGGVINGGYELEGSDTITLGPKKIVGNLEIEGSAILTLSGTLWVTGNVNVKNNGRVNLASSYGAMSGAIVADGTITLENNSISEGSGNAGSYLIYLSTNSANPALVIKNNAIAEILYTSQGWLEVQNNAQLVEVTGYGIHLMNNAIIRYETGLQDARFTAGPGAAWELSSWQEVE
jgi:Tfp pilus assembly protein PilX